MSGLDFKIRRIKKNKKQKDIAILLGITPSYVCIMENQKVPIPDDIYSKWTKII